MVFVLDFVSALLSTRFVVDLFLNVGELMISGEKCTFSFAFYVQRTSPFATFEPVIGWCQQLNVHVTANGTESLSALGPLGVRTAGI